MSKSLKEVLSDYKKIEQRGDGNPAVRAQKVGLLAELRECLCKVLRHYVRCLAVGPMDISEVRSLKSKVVDAYWGRQRTSLDVDKLSSEVNDLFEACNKRKLTDGDIVRLATLIQEHKDSQDDRFKM